ncbi:MAG TPA: permease, partial [Ramlibacter sp.]|nr:permease [Ramlibacter sp.]
QAITLGLLAAATGWLMWHWQGSPLVAMCGFLAILFGYAAFLAIEFIALRAVGSRDGVHPAPSARELARAWLRETVAAPRVFCWRQPFRWHAVPDLLQGPGLQGRRGVVFIHGFVCNRGFWTPWLRRMQADGRAFAAVNLEPVFGSIDDYVPIIDRAVAQVSQATGLAPVLVCHSMGGVAARAWLRGRSPGLRAAHIITIGTPHHGTWLARFSHLANGRQMRMGGDWLARLPAGNEGPDGPGFTCWVASCDNIVFPVATATLPGADNRWVRGAAHVDLAFEPEVMKASLALVAAL